MNDDLQAEYRAASLKEAEARERYNQAERALWDAEAEYDRARERVQRAFVALSEGK